MQQMPPLAGSGPWIIPADTTGQQRRDALQRIAVAGERDPALLAVAAKIRGMTGRGSSDAGQVLAARAQAALDFVHNLPWRDEGDQEVYQSVGRTLKYGGNCHDFSPALVALLHVLGIPSAKVTWLNQDGAPLNHVIVQLQTQRGWCWAETTVDGATVCEDPYAAERRLGSDRHAMGVAIPADVHAPAASGQDVATSTTKGPTPVAPATAVRTAQPPAASPSQRGPVMLAVVAKSGGLMSDPCDGAWNAFAQARANFNAPMPFPATGVPLRRNGGAALPDPAGQSSGIAASAYGPQVRTGQARVMLQRAVGAWLQNRGAAYGDIDQGSLYDWLNVASVALAARFDALSGLVTTAQSAYVACRKAGRIDASAVLAGATCAQWQAAPVALRRAVIHGYLAGRGYTLALDDVTLDALAASVTQACNVGSAPRKPVLPPLMAGRFLGRK